VVVCSLCLVAALAGCGGSTGQGSGGSSSTAHYAGAYYPIYNSGAGQWIEPTDSMPFDKVSAIFAAFAHAYPQGNGAVFAYEQGQPEEPVRLPQLEQVARQKSPQIKILISLGWGHNDWNYIAADYANDANLFVPSVIQFIRDTGVDGLDIDDEDIGVDGASGNITQQQFDGVIANLRGALDTASSEDGKQYELTITPAGNNDDTGGLAETQVDAQNAPMFDLINIQSYFSQKWGKTFLRALKSIQYPSMQIGTGIDTEKTKCAPVFPPYQGLAGLFDWNMTADSTCNDFKYTRDIAHRVGY
jgi:chitinase